jgi:predicted RNA-binding Zn ribbon-like protein
MAISHDTVTGIGCAVALVNTNVDGVETLTDVAALDALLDREQFSGRRDGTAAELRQMLALRRALRTAWEAPDTRTVVELANRLLREARALPRLSDHDGWDWHLHVTESDAPLVHRFAAEVGMALADLIRDGELDRLRVCAADDCTAVLVDLTRNHSRIYCDTGNCANREHVAAYRARRREAASGAAKRPRPPAPASR